VRRAARAAAVAPLVGVAAASIGACGRRRADDTAAAGLPDLLGYVADSAGTAYPIFLPSARGIRRPPGGGFSRFSRPVNWAGRAPFLRNARRMAELVALRAHG